jgi:NAD(P)-dependent dehydrogenase (short-subunit alcohol dehydrogenase family)
MPVESLANRHILVLGGSSGMGYATAAYLLRSKAVVTIGARETKRLSAARDSLVKDTGCAADNVRMHQVDGRDAVQVEAAVAHASNSSGQIDGAFVVAGGGGYVTVMDNTLEFCAEQYALNVFPLVNTLKSVVPRMKKNGGSIVALSSAVVAACYPRMSAYSAAKAGLEAYVRVAADELGQYKIRVNSVRSGFTKSGVTGKLTEDKQYIDGFTKATPLGAYGEAEDFGPMVSLLLSPETRWITGQAFAIDGGLTLRGYGGGIYPTGM